jgi:predicted AlkP superfamily pyrophosphatase or phosphodiesterase
MMSQKLLVMMIDGISADHITRDIARLPNLHRLIQRGTSIQRLRSEVLGTSLPGRTSMLTGATSDVSGVYANKIWDADAATFRYANPDDIRVPTLHRRAQDAGLHTANIGMGMVRPEDTDVFVAPWWTGAFVQRARDTEPEPADESWLRVATHEPDKAFVDLCESAGMPTDRPQLDLKNPAEAAYYGLVADHIMAEWVGVLAASYNAPHLITIEFLITDTIQHQSGWMSDLSRWSAIQADMALGVILGYLERAGTLDQWHIAVMSDHGHSPVKQSINTGVVLPDVTVQCEGGCLLVIPENETQLAKVTKALTPFDVALYPNDFIPPEQRGLVKVFVAPEGITFESEKDDDLPIGPPKAVSSHGQRPGLPGDDRFAVFAGPSVPHDVLATAEAIQVAPTFADLLGLPHDMPAASVLEKTVSAT